MINLNSLSKLKMTQEIIDKHISSTGAVNYFSGTKKEDGDIFFLGCLVIPDHPDLQIIADIPMKDIVSKSVADFLYTRTSIGWLYKEDKDGVLLLQDIGQDDVCEVCAIPKRMLVSIK